MKGWTPRARLGEWPARTKGAVHYFYVPLHRIRVGKYIASMKTRLFLFSKTRPDILKMKHSLEECDDSSESEAKQPTQKKKKKAPTLNEILDEFGPITGVDFEPFVCEAPQPATATLPPDFPPSAEPFDYFTLFFTPALLQIITTNTNQYANLQRLKVQEERTRQWRPLVAEELRVFIGALIYMGVHEEPRIDMYWNPDKKKGLIHTISTHIALNRYEEIKRYCHISDSVDDERRGYHLPTNSRWWYKVEPLASELQASCQKYYSPSSEVSIDELIVRCFGRSVHTYKMPNKPIKQGYKIYGIADHGYIYNWIWSSRAHGLQAIFKHPRLTPTGSLVRSLVLSLPRQHLTIYLDNYFTSIPLFQELRACGYGAVGTTRPHADLPESFKILKTSYAKALEWNTLIAKVVENTLCLAWQDNNIVLALSNVHTVHQADDFRAKIRKRPAKTSTNGRIVRAIFKDEHTKELLIPRFIDDYNHYMGGVHLANQYREVYETHRTTQRNWWPLFYWLLDMACINSYRLYLLYTDSRKPLTHLQFRIELYCKLLEYSKKVQLVQLYSELGGARLFNPDFLHIHFWGKLHTKRGTCTWCSYSKKRQKVLGILVQELPKTSYEGCTFCKVFLCKKGECWDRFHQPHVAY